MAHVAKNGRQELISPLSSEPVAHFIDRARHYLLHSVLTDLRADNRTYSGSFFWLSGV